MSKLKDNLEKVREGAKRANAAADPVADGLLQRAINSPYTAAVLFAVVIGLIVLGALLF